MAPLDWWSVVKCPLNWWSATKCLFTLLASTVAFYIGDQCSPLIVVVNVVTCYICGQWLSLLLHCFSVVKCPPTMMVTA